MRHAKIAAIHVHGSALFGGNKKKDDDSNMFRLQPAHNVTSSGTGVVRRQWLG
ncbi:hypothetical protein DOY81_008168 [Sarcophaga bullata]|nr:hypothetical protein DOY81_008168 [Sarcophaga bullata]